MKILLCTPISLNILAERLNIVGSIPPSYQYPLAAYFVELLVKKGHELHIVTSYTSVKKTTVIKGGGVTIYLTPYRRHYLFCFDFYRKEISEMVKLIKLINPDIVHAHWTYEFALAAIKSEYPHLITARDDPYSIAKLAHTPYRYYRLFFGKYVIKQIKNISYISPYLQQKYTRYKSNSKLSFVIPNGLQKKFFADAPKKIFKGKNITFGIISGTSSWKNVNIGLLSFCKLLKLVPNANMIIIGAGLDKESKLAKVAEKRNIFSQITFLGRQNQHTVFDILKNKVDVFIHTSLEESFGMTVLEAMACGLPVIAGKSSGAIPWILDYGKAGLLTDCTNVDEIADAMYKLATDIFLANEYAVIGWKRAMEKFTLDKITDEYVEVFQTILSDSAKKNLKM